MNPIDYAKLRDSVIDLLFEAAPNLLQDDVILEGVIYLVFCEVKRAIRDERKRRIEALREPRTFELN